MKKINRILAATLVLGFFAPLVAFGAYNDANLTTDTIISVGGVSLNVSGTTAAMQSITIDASSFSFVLESGSSIQVTSTERKELTTDAPAKYVETNSCDGTSSILKHSSSAASITITVTPQSYTCSNSSSSGSSRSGGGGGGGGGGSSTLPTLPGAVSLTPAPLVSSGLPSLFARNLSVGSTGDDVKALQSRLLSEGFFKGQTTGYFGPITKAALKAYQTKYGIDPLGIVGPMTRAHLNKGIAVPAQLTPTQVSAIISQINALLKQVQELQAKLKAQGN